MRYLEYELSRLVVTQTRIWLSFPAMARYRDFIKELGASVKADYPTVYEKIPNRTVRFLFKHKCLGYRPISWAVRRAYGVKKG